MILLNLISGVVAGGSKGSLSLQVTLDPLEALKMHPRPLCGAQSRYSEDSQPVLMVRTRGES